MESREKKEREEQRETTGRRKGQKRVESGERRKGGLRDSKNA